MIPLEVSVVGKKSCADCPASLAANEVRSKFKRSINGPVCGKFGIPLAVPNATPEDQAATTISIAATCSSYGNRLPALPAEKRFLVSFPNPVEELPEDDLARQSCTSCSMCKNFIRPVEVAESTGWSVGLCAAKGRLILSHEERVVATDCNFRAYGSQRFSMRDINLLPEYTNGIAAEVSGGVIKKASATVDPLDYETDAPVSDEDKANGIRAWRKIEDDLSGNSTFLPIFDPSLFTEELRDLIPKSGDPEHPELYVDHFGGVYMSAVCWTELDETPTLWGDAGTGKTELFRHLAWLMQLPFRRLSITGSTELDDLAGKMLFSKEQGTYFKYGRLSRAWTTPGVIVIDEPNTGPPDVWQFLRPLTDNSKQLVLDMNEGEVLSRSDNTYLGMAMNPSWDPKNVGALEIGDADANRLFHVYVTLPPEKVERHIIKSRVALDGWEITDKQLTMVMKIARDIRALIDADALTISWAIRPQIKVARALRWFDPITAYKRAIVDYLEPQAQQLILDAVRANVAH